MRAIKAIQFRYNPTAETQALIETFRTMVNRAISIGIGENVHGRYALRNRIYRDFREAYGVMSQYPYSVAEVAWSILKKHRRWHRRPYARRPMLKLDSGAYSIEGTVLAIQYRPERRLLIPLELGQYQRQFLAAPGLRRGSLTMTATKVVIAFSTDVPVSTPKVTIGVDINAKSVVLSNGVKYDTSEIPRMQREYSERRRRFQTRHSNDRRLIAKYSSRSRERARISQSLNRVSKSIVGLASQAGGAIVMERLTKIRKRFTKNNRTRKPLRAEMNRWPFFKLQSQIVYKSGWAGISVEFVNPGFTSKKCSVCGQVNLDLEAEKTWQCPECGCQHDRDLNAAINIARRSKYQECLPLVQGGAGGGRSDEAGARPASRHLQETSGRGLRTH